MEFYEIKNKLLKIMNTKEFMDSLDDYNQVEAIEIYIENASITWNDITDDVFFYIHCYYDKDKRDNNYDVYGFQLGESGYLMDYANYMDNRRPITTLHETFPGFITPEFDAEIYINLVEAHIKSNGLCPIKIIPKLPIPIIKILNDLGSFDSFTLNDKMKLYEKTKNSIFLEKEILDIFIF